MTTNDLPMGSPDDSGDHQPGDELTACVCQAENAIRRLARLTLDGPSLTPAEIDVVLGYLAETVAALPQVAAHLGDILDRTKDTHLLAMDGMTATTDPDIAIDIALLNLDQFRRPVVDAYRHLEAARNEVAHISATPGSPGADVADASPPPHHGVRHQPPEDRPPPSRGPGVSRRGPAR